ncbi:HEAT repeat domain-containing protein [Actinomadura sp. WMMB 499]|uniref:HEAT repeat domain-containing protein n=1 Tax=Actinomadura sp. WMMB 499 TaxID=1219491 RepID=UPI001C3FC94A|nr:HEAT repeat domain-containing protein [Actinomadura sp. WMMB 499]
MYDCTRAAVPFLLEIAAGDAPGRDGVLELLGSIGGSGDAPATAAVAAATPVFLGLIADPDAGVREGALRALAACGSRSAEIVPALRRRLADEPDADVRRTIVEVRAGLGEDPRRLHEIVDGAGDPGTRLAALAAVARTYPAPARRALALIDELVAGAPAPRARDERPATPTLIGNLRALTAGETGGRRVPELGDLVHGLGRELGDRAAQRVELAEGLLRAPDRERRIDGLRAAGGLTRALRGPYGDVVTLVGERLADPEPRVAGAAVGVLEDLFALAAPAADDLAAFLEAAPRARRYPEDRREGWVDTYASGPPSVGGALKALARLGDARALPMLREVLEWDEPPPDLGWAIGALGEAAAGLVPLIRRRLTDLPAVSGYDRPRDGLAWALSTFGPAAAEAVPELVALLRAAPGSNVHHALRRLGPAAPEAVPVLRGLLDGTTRDGLDAARTLWAIEGDAGAVLPVLLAGLDEPATPAIEGLAALGPAGRPAAGRLRELMASGDTGPGAAWPRLHAAEAVWRTEGEVAGVLPVLRAVWAENVHTRVHVAGVLGEMGTDAREAAPLLEDELGRTWRHTHSPHGGSSSHDVDRDEKLLAACDSALRSVTR